MQYRFYFVDEFGRIIGAKDHEAAEDGDAITDAQILSVRGPVVVWEGTRPIAKIAKGGQAEPATSLATILPE